MRNLQITGSRDIFFIPSVDFNYETGICQLSGESFLEETDKFYQPLLAWLNAYISEQKSIYFIFKLTYFNTSTSRSVHEILMLLKNYELKGGQVKVDWYYDEEDLDMVDDIEDYIIETGLQVNIRTF